MFIRHPFYNLQEKLIFKYVKFYMINYYNACDYAYYSVNCCCLHKQFLNCSVSIVVYRCLWLTFLCCVGFLMDFFEKERHVFSISGLRSTVYGLRSKIQRKNASKRLKTTRINIIDDLSGLLLFKHISVLLNIRNKHVRFRSFNQINPHNTT